MVFTGVGDGGGSALRGRSSTGIGLAVLSFALYAATLAALPWTWNTQYCCEQQSFAVAISQVRYRAPLGTMRPDILDYVRSHEDLPLKQILDGVRSIPRRRPPPSGGLLKTTFDGNGIGYPLVATAAFRLLGLRAWAPLAAMLGLMAVAAAALLRRFGPALSYVVTLYFAALTALLFTAIVWEPLFRTQIPVSGIRYFSLVAVLPTLHILLHLCARAATDPRVRRQHYALLGVHAAILTVAALVRSSAASLFAAIAIAWLIQLWRRDRPRPPIGNAVIIGAVIVGLGGALVFAMPKEFRSEGRVGTVVWHRLAVSLGLNPAFPFPGLNDMVGDCPELQPEGLHSGLWDGNGQCLWIDYQTKHGLPVTGSPADYFNAEYDAALRQQFFKIAAQYPSEVLATFLYYKPQILLRSLGSALSTNFANDPQRVVAAEQQNYMPYSAVSFGLLIAALAVAAVHLAIAGAAPAGLGAAAAITLWAALWTIPAYLVAWPNPMTIADLTLYCLVLAALALGGAAAGVRRLVGRRHRTPAAAV